MGNTNENLAAAFAGESQANRRYLAFAKKADEEGHEQVAKLFRAVAAAETVHAHAHLRVMGGIKSSKENLGVAIEGEAFEYTKMYPEYIGRAKQENNTDAVISFSRAKQVEEIHHNLYTQAVQDLESGRKRDVKAYYVCQVCGNTVENEASDKCLICGAPKEKFLNVD